MLVRQVILTLFFFFFAFSLSCSVRAQVDDLDEIHKDTTFYLSKSSFYFIDSLSQYSFEDIRDSNILKQFKPLVVPHNQEAEFPTGCQGFFNNNCHTLWVKSRVRNISPHPGTFFLAYYYWWGDYQQSFILRSNDSVEVKYAGFYNPASKETPDIQRLSILTKYFKIAPGFDLQPQEEVMIYTKLNHSSSFSFRIDPRVSTESNAKRRAGFYFNLLPGYLLFVGFLGFLILIGVAISLVFRDTAFWLFSGYVLSIAIVTIFVGDFQALFIPEYPEASYIAFSVALCISPAFYGGFLYSFLNIAKSGRILRMLFYVGISSSILVALFQLLLMIWTSNWYLADAIGDAYTQFALVLLLPFMIFSLKQRRWDYYFIFAGSAFLLLGGLAYYFFEGQGITSATVLKISIILQLLTFAVGLGYKMLRSEKEKIRLATNSEIKSKLYTNITHEFRTPLTVIMGITDNIEGHEKEKQLISRNSKNLLQLINQMLDLSKLESGNLQLDLVNGNVVSYLRYLTESFHSMAIEKKLTLVFESDDDKIEMAFDEVKLQQLVFNLLSNAMKFTPEGGSVKVKISQIMKEGTHYLNLSVQDTGIGIEQDQIPKIFDRFYQTDQSSTRKNEGTGIGLAFTKELIELMKGHIEVTSEWNKGSTFSLFIPIEKNESTKAFSIREKSRWKPAPPVLSKEEIVSTTFDTGLPHLLLIEDNKDVAHYIQQLLKKEYQVTLARNGLRGIQQALENLPDIIISDVMMPEKDGFEVCATLKADERTSHIPIILLTAKAQQADKLTGLKYGADAYLMKPFDKEELFIRLHQLVQLRQTLYEKYSQAERYLTAPPENEEPTLEDIFLQKVRDAIEAEIDNAAFSIPDLCETLLLSNMQLYRKLKALTGQTPILFIRSYRLQKARHLLQTTDLNISEIAYDVGFTDPSYFSRAFKKEFGHSPSDFRK
jgi:signal transduction histidine kinase/DNA-binding response OmpR family regulator